MRRWVWILIGMAVGAALLVKLCPARKGREGGLERAGRKLDKAFQDMDRELDEEFPQKR